MDPFNLTYTVCEIKNKSIKGIKWVGLAEVIVRIMQVISSIILARLLGPTTFGAFGICLIFYRFLHAIGDLGFGTAIIQKKNIEQKELESIFFLCLIFSTTLCLILYFSADYVQDFFSFGDLAKTLRILSFIFIIAPCSTILRSLFIRELNFDKLTISEVLSLLCNSVTAIFLAYKGFGIWSLITGLYIENILLTILLFHYGSWIPRLRISFTHIKEISNFACNVILARLAYFFNANIDKFLVGKFLGEHYLGIYIITYNLIDIPVQRLSKNAIKVTFSTLSKFQDNLMEFRKTYKTLNYYLSLIIFPVFIGLLIVAPEFTRVFYGPQWEEMIIPLRILCLAGIFRSLLVVSSTTLFAINKPKLEVMLALFQGSIIFSSAIVLLQFGISGVSIGVTTGYLIGFFVSLIVSLTIVGMKFREYVELISNPLIGVGIIIGIWFINFLIFKHLLTDVIFMIMNIGISMILFIIYISAKDRTIFYQLRKILLTTYE